MSSQLDFNTTVAPPLPLRRFSVEQYHQLGKLGVLTPEDRVELLEGWIVEKMNQRPIHSFIVGLISELLQSSLPSGISLRCQLPLSAERSEPEPDIAIVRGEHADFRDRHPSGKDCQLVIEVSDTSIEKDRAKARIYQEAGVPEYWIVNVAERCIEQYTFIDSQAERQPRIISGEEIAELALGDTLIAIELKRLFV